MRDSSQQPSFAAIKGAVSLKDWAESNLQPAPRGIGHKAYVCPFCGSGSHGANSDSAFSIEPGDRRFKCFSCQAGGDVFDLAAQVHGIDPGDRRAVLRAVADWAGIDVGGSGERPAGNAREVSNGVLAATRETEADYSEGQAEQRAYLLKAKGNIADPACAAYLESRGYDLETAERLGLGYDPDRKRLIMPWPGSDYYHVDRDVSGRAETDRRRPKYLKPPSTAENRRGEKPVGPQPLYNPAALKGEAFALVEGPFDALALETMGIPAVCEGGVGGRRQLVAALTAIEGDRPTVLLALDRDAAGQEAAAAWAADLESAHLPYRLVEWPEDLPGKDADEMRKHAPEATGAFLRRVYDETLASRREDKERAYKAALKRLRVVDASDTAAALYLLQGVTRPTPTGLAPVDKALSGGLPAGLVTLGAVSSVGKTTLALQMADNIARAGRGVLFVTIEQSARELVAKSLSRLTAELPGNAGLAATAGEIADPDRRGQWGQAETQRLIDALESYDADIAPNLHILEGIEQPSVSDIQTLARSIAAHDGQAPVVFIDYLQLLKAPDDRDDDKRATDKNVMALRHLARDLKTPVVVISSLNRASYSAGVTLDSFKESGAIEYGSDVLLGLQPAEMYKQVEGVAENKAKGKAREIMREHKGKAIRSCELVILKNRAGATPDDGIPLTFDAPHSLWRAARRPSNDDLPVG